MSTANMADSKTKKAECFYFDMKVSSWDFQKSRYSSRQIGEITKLIRFDL